MRSASGPLGVPERGRRGGGKWADALKQLQSQTQARFAVDALLPSVLDKAFKGEL